MRLVPNVWMAVPFAAKSCCDAVVLERSFGDGGTTEMSAPVSMRYRLEVFGSCMCIRWTSAGWFRLLLVVLLVVGSLGGAVGLLMMAVGSNSPSVECTPRYSRRKKYTSHSGYHFCSSHTFELQRHVGSETNRSNAEMICYGLEFLLVG